LILIPRPLAAGSFIGHSKVINSIAIDITGTVLWSGSEDDTLRLWNVRTAQELSTIQAELGGIKTIAIHPNKKIIAAGGNYGAVKLWDWHTGKLISSFSNHLVEVTALAFSPDGQTLVAGDRDGKMVTYIAKNVFVNKLDSP
jgi:WD40 repeat protein